MIQGQYFFTSIAPLFDDPKRKGGQDET